MDSGNRFKDIFVFDMLLYVNILSFFLFTYVTNANALMNVFVTLANKLKLRHLQAYFNLNLHLKYSRKEVKDRLFEHYLYTFELN